LDLALALVEADLGREIAKNVAGQLVMFFKRTGDQMQLSRKNEVELVGRSTPQEVQRWAANNPAADLSLPETAKRMGITPRQFARLFRAEVGVTPAAWVESVPIGAARRLRDEGTEAPNQVATHCGFADTDTLRRAFVRQIGVTPGGISEAPRADASRQGRDPPVNPARFGKSWPVMGSVFTSYVAAERLALRKTSRPGDCTSETGQHLMRAFEAGFDGGAKPVGENAADTVLTLRIADGSSSNAKSAAPQATGMRNTDSY
jgi:AraC-like DNA-binding protein